MMLELGVVVEKRGGVEFFWVVGPRNKQTMVCPLCESKKTKYLERSRVIMRR